MTIAERQAKLYLGVISAGEQAYSLGAAISEVTKQLKQLDKTVSNLRKDFQFLKKQLKGKCPNCGCPVIDGICQNYGCEPCSKL
jgi:hypothetical protein